MEDTRTPQKTSAAGNEAKTIAIIAYLTLIGLLIAFVMNNDKKYEFASYHIRQSLGLILISLGLFIIGAVPVLGWIASFLGSVFLLVLWIFGLINAINHEKKPVPVLGTYFEEWFRNVQ